MSDLREQLRKIFQGRVCLVGVGNVELGDDGLGVRLAEAVGDLRFTIYDLRILVAGCKLDHYLAELSGGDFDHVLFLDAVEFGGEPGAVVLLNSSEIVARFPQISTHKLSLELLARMIEANGTTTARLLGVQPESLRAGTGLSPKVQVSVDLLAALLAEVAQTSSLLCRRLPFGQSSESSGACGLEIRDTAEWNSAPRLSAETLGENSSAPLVRPPSAFCLLPSAFLC